MRITPIRSLEMIMDGYYFSAPLRDPRPVGPVRRKLGYWLRTLATKIDPYPQRWAELGYIDEGAGDHPESVSECDCHNADGTVNAEWAQGMARMMTDDHRSDYCTDWDEYESALYDEYRPEIEAIKLWNQREEDDHGRG